MVKTGRFSSLKFYVLFVAGNVLLLLLLIFIVRVMRDENKFTEVRRECTELAERFNSRIFLRNFELAATVADMAEDLRMHHAATNGDISLLDALEIYRYSADADIVYILNRKGIVTESTKYLGEDLTGRDYSFRPYFTGAMNGIPRVYGAYGVTTGKRGIYFSAPVYTSAGSVSGVAVIKTGSSKIEEILLDADGPAVLLSPEGVIFASNVKEWTLKTYGKLPLKTMETIKNSKQYPEDKLEPLDVRITGDNDVMIGKTRYIKAESELSVNGWKAVVFSEKNGDTTLTALQRNTLLAGSVLFVTLFFIMIIMQMNAAAEAALRRSRGSYAEIFNAVNDAILIHGIGDGMVTDINKRCLEMYECTRQQYFAATPSVFSAADEGYDMKRALELVKKAAAGEPQVFEWRARTYNGRKFWVEVILKKARIEDTDVVLSVVRDITERKKAGEKTAELIDELRRSNRDLQDFAYAASHDLKEPLRMVSSYVQLLEKKYKGKLDADADEFIGYATNGAKHMQRLIDDMLAFSRLGTKGGEFVPVNTAELLENIMTSLKFKIADKKAVIERGKMPVVNADPTQLEMVFQNLVTNALKFSRPEVPPVIRISAEMVPGFWKFTVSDNGIGIDPKYFEKIFVIFQKLHPRDQYEGTGIGLTMVKKIVERHGGRIWLESTPGRGTDFYFTIKA